MVQVLGGGKWPTTTDDPNPANPTTGTDVNESFLESPVASIAAAIDDQTHAPGANYQNTRPREITVEVIDARGTALTLGARLNVAIGPDGTPLNQLPPKSVRNGFVLGNLLANDTFLMWSRGAALAPDFWALSGAGAAIQQCGAGLADASVMPNQGHFSARLTYGAAAAILQQKVFPTPNLSWLAGNREQPVGADGNDLAGYNDGPCKAWIVGGVSASAANRARIAVIDTATGPAYSQYHPGDSAFHLLVAGPLNLTDGGSDVWGQCRVEAAGAAYFQCLNLILTDSDLPPHYVPARVKLVAYPFLPIIATPAAATGYGYVRSSRPFQALALAADVYGAVPTGGTTLKLDVMTPVGGTFVSIFNTVPAFVASDRHLFKEVDSTVANYRRRTCRGNYAAGGAANLADNSIFRLDVNARDSGNTATNVAAYLIGLEYDTPFNQFRIGSDLLEA